MKENNDHLLFTRLPWQIFSLNRERLISRNKIASHNIPFSCFMFQRGINSASVSHAPLLHEGSTLAHYPMNPIKGRLTESIANRTVSDGFLSGTGKWIPGSPARIGNTGIDGLYFHTDRTGNIRDVLVTEAKYDTSRLSTTTTGRQMGAKWTSERLYRTSRMYSNLKEEISRKSVSRYFKSKGKNTIKVPLRNGNVAEVWRTNDGLAFFSNDKNVSVVEIELQSRRVSQGLKLRAEGKIPYRSRIIRYKSVGKQHQISITSLDAKTGMKNKVEKIEGRYKDLPDKFRKMLHSEFEKVFCKMGKSRLDARKLADSACKDPKFLKSMRRDARWTWKAGLDRQAGVVAIKAGCAAFIFDISLRYIVTKNIYLKQSANIGALGTLSTFVGRYADTQVDTLLCTTRIGQNILKRIPLRAVAGTPIPKLIGNVAGGIAASAVFAYGLYLLGYSDLKTANRTMFASGVGISGGVTVSYGTVSLVAIFWNCKHRDPNCFIEWCSGYKCNICMDWRW